MGPTPSLPMEKFRETLALGEAQFVELILKHVGHVPREVEGKSRLRPRLPMQTVIEAVEGMKGEPAKEWMERHGDPGKWMVMAMARRYCGMTLGEVGEAMGRRDYASVGMGIKRLEKPLETRSKIEKCN